MLFSSSTTAYSGLASVANESFQGISVYVVLIEKITKTKMLFTSTTTAGLLAAVGEVSSPVFDNVLPYLLVAAGIPLAFYIVRKIIGLIPKGR
jgi:hypothetical protein